MAVRVAGAGRAIGAGLLVALWLAAAPVAAEEEAFAQVRLRLQVGADGTVQDASILSSNPPVAYNEGIAERMKGVAVGARGGAYVADLELPLPRPQPRDHVEKLNQVDVLIRGCRMDFAKQVLGATPLASKPEQRMLELLRVADIAVQEQDFTAAAKAYKQARKTGKRRARSWLSGHTRIRAAAVDIKRGELRKARSTLEQQRQLGSDYDFPAAALWLAAIHLQDADWEKADRELASALASSETLQDLRGRLMARLEARQAAGAVDEIHIADWLARSRQTLAPLLWSGQFPDGELRPLGRWYRALNYTMELEVGTDGLVQTVQLQGPPPGRESAEVLAEVEAHVIENWRFVPAYADCKPIPARYTLLIESCPGMRFGMSCD